MTQPQPKIGWSFKSGTMWDGWNDSAIATFRNKILESLTREIIQNSLDASVSPDEPVYIDFDEIKMSRDEIPDIDQLKETLDRCWKLGSSDNDRTRRELRTAIDTISKAKIPVLRISDEGTTGMPGPCKFGTPFFSYLKARGQSGGSDSRGGSHGIGKAAPLCASNLRTIFVSSRWMDDESGEEQAMIQGRSTLMSHYDDEGNQMAGIGFWGKVDGDDAISGDECEYDWLKRDDIGTSVFVVGWNRSNTSDWKSYIIAWAAVNYFTAFHRKRLILRVDGDELDYSNIADVLSNDKYHQFLKAEQKGYRLSDARYYFQCLSDDEQVKVDETELIHIGHSKLRMIVDEGTPRKIAIIRKNMLITDQLNGYWTRPPNRLQDFAGVFECVNDDGEKLIRAMEPPAHDDLSKDYLPVDERDRGASALKSLANKLKEMTEKHASNETQEAGEVDFLREFFSDEAGDGDGDQELEDRDPSGNFVITPKPVKLPPPKPVVLEPEPESDDDTPDDDMPDEDFPGCLTSAPLGHIEGFS